jgi:hypothetical protein
MLRSGFVAAMLAAGLVFGGAAAHAADLPLPKLHKHKVEVHFRHHGRVVRRERVHFGYYFGQWGWRWGGTVGSWYDSRFALAGGPGWNGAPILLASSSKRFAAIDCSGPRPRVCLAEPIVAPVRRAEPVTWR